MSQMRHKRNWRRSGKRKFVAARFFVAAKCVRSLAADRLRQAYPHELFARRSSADLLTLFAGGSMIQRLTRREIQCVRLAGEGLSNKEIALRLRVSPSTVNNHFTNAYAKLGSSDRNAAAAIVARDYPDFTRFPPMPIAAAQMTASTDETPGSIRGDAGAPQRPSDWFLPPPPARRVVRLLVILVFAIIAAVVTIGLVAVVGASMSAFADHAPPNAVLAVGN